MFRCLKTKGFLSRHIKHGKSNLTSMFTCLEINGHLSRDETICVSRHIQQVSRPIPKMQGTNILLLISRDNNLIASRPNGKIVKHTTLLQALRTPTYLIVTI